jgi:hypothetical protein
MQFDNHLHVTECGVLSRGQYVWTQCREEDNWVMASGPKPGKALSNSD